MPKLPVFRGKELIKFLEYLGFQVIRTKGSHSRLRSEDGRVTSVPVHGNRDVPKGLLRKIIREDLEMSLEEFTELYYKTSKTMSVSVPTAYRWINAWNQDGKE